VLDISSLGGPPLPSVQNLLNPLTNQSVAIRDLIAVPSQDEEKLNHLSLQVRPIMLGKEWNLRWKTNAVGANGSAKGVEAQHIDRLPIRRLFGAGFLALHD
jgi:hypothetical protein